MLGGLSLCLRVLHGRILVVCTLSGIHSAMPSGVWSFHWCNAFIVLIRGRGRDFPDLVLAQLSIVA